MAEDVDDRADLVRDAGGKKGPKGAPVDTTRQVSRDDTDSRADVIRDYPRTGPKGEPVDTTRDPSDSSVKGGYGD